MTSQQFIQSLIESGEKLSLEDFFKTMHSKFYSHYVMKLMTYFLELAEHEGEFIVHHEKLIEYGILSSNNSNDVRERLDALGLIENEDYRLQDILQPVKQGGTSTKNVYILTSEAFKTCLLRARQHSKQTVDPQIYAKYYLILEKMYKMYTDYEKQLLTAQLQQKKLQLHQEGPRA